MNILLFCSGKDGLTYKLTQLANGLKKKTNVVAITSCNEEVPGLYDKLLECGVIYYKCHYIDILSLYSIIKASRFIRNVIKEEAIDLIHLQGLVNLPAVLLALKLDTNHRNRVQIALTLHSSLMLESPRYRPILSLTSNLIDSFLTVSDSSKERLYNIGIPLKKIATVHNAIDFAEFDRFNSENKYDNHLEKLIRYDPNDKIVAYIAALRPAKGHIYLLEAIPYILKHFSNVKILLVGAGSHKEKLKLENLASELNISDNVIFTGQVYNYLIPRLLDYIDIGVSPSLREVCPHNILEFMAAKKSVVATNVGGTVELVKHGVNGFIVPPKDPDSLAKAVCSLLDNPEKVLEMGIKGRQICEEKFDTNVITEKLIENYQTIIANKK